MQIKHWEQQVHRDITMSVNLSPRQFIDDNLITYVQQAIEQSGISSEQFDLEITETTAMHAIDKAIDSLYKLKTLGV